jgi:hypothetical protein
MDEQATSILIEKPERITGFDVGLAGRLRDAVAGGKTALVEIAGRDSVAAGVLAASSFDFLVPTVVYSGTGYGDWEVMLDNAGYLADLLEHRDDVRVIRETVLLGSPRWWHAAGGRFATVLWDRYGFLTTCVACHMYFHAARVPFAREIGAEAVVAGERLLHQDRRKVNQVGPALGSYSMVLNRAGVDLMLPLKDVRDGSLVEELVGPWPESSRQLTCVLESNYRDSSGEFEVPEESLRAYLEQFLEPFSSKILAEYGEGVTPRYMKIAEDVLSASTDNHGYDREPGRSASAGRPAGAYPGSTPRDPGAPGAH